MAKPFQLIVTLSQTAPMDTMRKIGGLRGVTKIEFADSISAKKPNGHAQGGDRTDARRQFGEAHRVFLFKLIAKKPMNRREMRLAFEQAGRPVAALMSPLGFGTASNMISRKGDKYELNARGKEYLKRQEQE